MKSTRLTAAAVGLLAAVSFVPAGAVRAQVPDVEITGLPDYGWYAGCFGTACGNLIGYWDRTGLPDFYTGPTGGGVAPLDTQPGNRGIRSMWASRAGYDGRPLDRLGHTDDYWAVFFDGFDSYEDTGDDRYVVLGRPDHAPDCIGDFIGLSQKKYTNLNNECAGNIDGYSFVYWDATGDRRTNFTKSVDIQSGLKAWARFRGYDADVFTQLAEFNPHTPPGKGFTWADLKAEINAGYPLLIFLQSYAQNSRYLGSMTNANPIIHGMLAFGYEELESLGIKYVYVRTSWASGEGRYYQWHESPWELGLSVRGVIGFRPRPKVRSISRNGRDVTVSWDGPSALLSHFDQNSQTYSNSHPHRYQLERSATLNPPIFTPVGPVTTNRVATIEDCCDSAVFFRVNLFTP